MKAIIPKSIREGELTLGSREISCAVFEDGTHIISCPDLLKALGRPWRKTYKSVDRPGFLAAQNLAPFLDDSLNSGQRPWEFRTLHGGRKSGYRAEVLPKACKVYLMAGAAGVLRHNQERIASACEEILEAIGDADIETLIDQATGYQDIRDRRRLHRYLERYFTPNLAGWVKRIPEDYFRELFRLKGWNWRGMSLSRPGAVGKLTNDLVFERLEPAALKELLRISPNKIRTRKRKSANPWLNHDVGHPALESHVFAVVSLMRASANWGQFHRLLQRSFPKNSGMAKPVAKRRGGVARGSLAL